MLFRSPRNVLAHAVSGAVAGAIISTAINYKKVQKKQMSKKEALKDTLKLSAEGAIVTASAIATANYLGQSNGLLKAITATAVGVGGIYALHSIESMCEQKYLTNETKTQE